MDPLANAMHMSWSSLLQPVDSLTATVSSTGSTAQPPCSWAAELPRQLLAL
jgi:hypothetical protein